MPHDLLRLRNHILYWFIILCQVCHPCLRLTAPRGCSHHGANTSRLNSDGETVVKFTGQIYWSNSLVKKIGKDTPPPKYRTKTWPWYIPVYTGIYHTRYIPLSNTCQP
jgi:hypothetical protein